MNAEINFDIVTREWVLAFVDQQWVGGELRVLEPGDDGRLVARLVPHGEEIRMALRGFNPQHLIDALAKAGFRPSDDKAPTVQAQERHLSDALAVRDRLLTLVEKHF